jgi:hypothetical protein
MPRGSDDVIFDPDSDPEGEQPMPDPTVAALITQREGMKLKER